jgi:small subunit ribosomal protein S6
LETAVKRLYEGLFLVDSAQATADWDAVVALIKNILQRADAEIVSMRKWDERKLAYEIDGKARGTYILCYFRAGGGRMRDIERDVRLSEQIMRVLILNAEVMSQEDIEKDTPAAALEKYQKQTNGDFRPPEEANGVTEKRSLDEETDLEQQSQEPDDSEFAADEP